MLCQPQCESATAGHACSLSSSSCVQGVKRCSPITGCEEFYYPAWKRALFRWLVSLPICILCLCFVFVAMLLCLELQVRTSTQRAS